MKDNLHLELDPPKKANCTLNDKLVVNLKGVALFTLVVGIPGIIIINCYTASQRDSAPTPNHYAAHDDKRAIKKNLARIKPSDDYDT